MFSTLTDVVDADPVPLLSWGSGEKSAGLKGERGSGGTNSKSHEAYKDEVA